MPNTYSIKAPGKHTGYYIAHSEEEYHIINNFFLTMFKLSLAGGS